MRIKVSIRSANVQESATENRLPVTAWNSWHILKDKGMNLAAYRKPGANGERSSDRTNP